MVGVPSVTLLLHLLLIRFWGVHVAGPKIVAATHAMQPIKAMPSKHNSSDHTTVAMQEQFDALRQREQQMLARRVLDIVGTRKGDDGVPIVTDADMRAHDTELRALLGHVRAYYTAHERQRMYKRRVNTGVSLAKLVLSTTGHEPRGAGAFAVKG
eukprot:m.157198 g.157198  ORF g.157198 m.157198 type:complete len:155 (-) comp11727_c0_seq7:56-520(-)